MPVQTASTMAIRLVTRLVRRNHMLQFIDSLQLNFKYFYSLKKFQGDFSFCCVHVRHTDTYAQLSTLNVALEVLWRP